jgi:hypothetical protein
MLPASRGPRKHVPVQGADAVTPDEENGRRIPWRRRWTLRLVLTAAVLAALTFIAAANYAPVEVRLIGWQGGVRLSWALLTAVAAGFGLGFIAALLLR